MPTTKKYRVETDKGSYVVEVEIPDAPAPEGPSAKGFAHNVGTSLKNTVQGVRDGVALLNADPVEGIRQMGSGIVDRAKAYKNDMHPVEALHSLTTDDDGSWGFHPLEAIGQFLPVSMMYEDPVGVAADVMTGKGAVKGGLGVKNMLKAPPIETSIRGALEQTRGMQDAVPNRNQNPTRLVSTPPAADAPPPTDAVSARGRMGAWSPESGPRNEPANPTNLGGKLVGHIQTLEEIMADAAKAALNPTPESATVAPSHPSGGSYTIPEHGLSQNVGGKLGGAAPQLEQVLSQALNEAAQPVGPNRVSAPPPPDAAGAGREPIAGRKKNAATTSGNPSRGAGVDIPVPEGVTPESGPGRMGSWSPEHSTTVFDDLLRKLGGTSQVPELRDSNPMNVERRGAPSNMEGGRRATDQPLPTLDELRASVGAERAAQDPRMLSVSQELGIPLGPDAVQDMTGGPSRLPLTISNGPGTAAQEGLDRGFARRMADDRGAAPMIPRLLEDMLLAYMAKQLGVPTALGKASRALGGVIPPAATALSSPRFADPTPHVR